ncbi:MAG: DUF2182 domain-containing protein [Proteobacteria bacterium]|nr:DUF2182 domain-containing protein [Pseudomonadota bacterium]
MALLSLLAVAALAWAYLWFDAARMSSMPMGASVAAGGGMAMAPAVQVWTIGWLLLTFLMWSIMMVAMMLPSAASAVLLYGSMVSKNRERGVVLPSVWLFVAGYLAVWNGFSLAATLLQAGLHDAALLTPMMASKSASLTGGLLIVAGVYQWLPVKEACLEKCRAPLQFFLFRWRPGMSGAFRMGVEHGAFCVGCCWALMLLLFAAGVMNLLWVAVIAGFVLLEKLLPGGRFFGRLAGVLMTVYGVGMMTANL